MFDLERERRGKLHERGTTWESLVAAVMKVPPPPPGELAEEDSSKGIVYE
jgi:hypothetical protein